MQQVQRNQRTESPTSAPPSSRFFVATVRFPRPGVGIFKPRIVTNIVPTLTDAKTQKKARLLTLIDATIVLRSQRPWRRIPPGVLYPILPRSTMERGRDAEGLIPVATSVAGFFQPSMWPSATFPSNPPLVPTLAERRQERELAVYGCPGAAADD